MGEKKVELSDKRKVETYLRQLSEGNEASDWQSERSPSAATVLQGKGCNLVALNVKPVYTELPE